MHIVSIFLFIFTYSWNLVQAIDQTHFDEKLYRQALQYDSSIAENYFCWSIPTEAFLEFAEVYAKRPIPVNTFGMGSQGNFFLWHLIKQMNPVFIIESGVFKGQSTWTIEKAAPKAKILALDPDSDWRTYKSRKAAYSNLDFSQLQINASMFKGPVVCFFDDKANAFERVIQAHEKGFKYLIFNNNCPSSEGEDNAGYLTLQQCFENKANKEKAKILRKIVKHYYIMPQIVGKKSNYPFCDEKCNNLPAIWEKPEDITPELREKLNCYIEDSKEYRWITFVELY